MTGAGAFEWTSLLAFGWKCLNFISKVNNLLALTMLMQLRGYKPIARFILIRLTFSLVIACVLTITLITTVVWTRGFQKTDILRSQHEYRRQSYNLEEIVRINEAKRCFEPIHERSKTHLLDDILEGDLKPNPGKSIFFHETSCIPSGTIVLNAR